VINWRRARACKIWGNLVEPGNRRLLREERLDGRRSTTTRTGKSDGLYDEGFAPDRARGYTCDPERSLAGADRALDDIEAAVTALKERPDIAHNRIVVGGASKGPVLSIVYAAAHSEEVRGVINFVGGRIGEGCGPSSEINRTLFRRGGKFEGSTLWLYGHNDPTYSIDHSRSNYDAFVGAGGRGDFFRIR
jgi:dienelactone hydrolase